MSKTILTKINKDIFDFGQNSSIQELEDILIKASDIYYNTPNPILQDAQFDILLDFLRKRNPKAKFIKQVGAPTKNQKIKLDYYLGSMDKVKPSSNKLDNWKKKYKGPYYLSDKLDGISGLVIYHNNKIKLTTRGTATHGTDITSLVKYLNLPKYDQVINKLDKLNIKGIKNTIALRGEIIMSKKNFDKYSKEFKNSRNLVSGLVNSKTKKPQISADLDFVIYNILDPIMTFKEQIDLAHTLGFKTVYYQKETDITYPVISYILKNRKNNSPYIVDGIIVTNNLKYPLPQYKNPEYAFAFKELLEDTFKEADVIDIEWNVSKSGKIMPTVLINPIDIGGVTISRVTAFNAKYVKDNGIGKGAKIQITRSGDVIPYIVKIIKKVKPDFPKIKYKWSDSGVDIETLEISKEQKIRQNYFFFKTLNTKGFGLRLIVKLYQNNFKTIESILKMSKEDFLTLDGVKDKSANNLYQELVRIKSIKFPIETLILATNSLGENLGSRKAKLIFDKYPNILKETLDTKWINKLIQIDGIENKTAQQIIDNWDKLLTNIKWLQKYFTFDKIKVITKNKSTLKYKTWVLTGFRDNNLQQQILDKGGKIANTISKNTDILVVKDKEYLNNPTSKVIKATQLGIKIIDKSQAYTFL